MGELLGPAQDGLLLGDAVGRVDKREALSLGSSRLVVLDVAGDEHVGDLGDAAGDRPGAGAGQHGDAPDLAAGVARVAPRAGASSRRDLGGERRQRRRGRQHAEPAEAQRGDFVLERDDIVGRLLVGVSRRAPPVTRRRSRRGKTTSRRSSSTVSSRPACPSAGSAPSRPKKVPCPPVDHEQCSYSPITPAPAAKTALRTRSASSTGTKPTSLRASAAADQRRRGLEAEQPGHHVGEATLRLVEAGVRGDHGHTLARGTKGKPPGETVVREALERVEDRAGGG